MAHSIALSEKRRLRKGRVLSADDVQALAEADHASVVVAQLEQDDVHEDAAAADLAAALVPDPDACHVTLTNPFTGRVNVLAAGAGVAELDVAALEAVNRVHPMITVATVPAYQQMADRGMIATIKIISYAVPKIDLEKACAAARGAIRMIPPKAQTVDLIISDIPGGVGDKGWQAIADRTAAFGISLPTPVRVPHQVVALSRALIASKADVILVLTGSATSDIHDVAPSAVAAAGGQVGRFGMPVDPGNLLFIGHLSGRPVIGLPGCARAPALNGADWVLARLICGLEVTDEDISAMGVGGLLKEIPSRPQPRRAQRRT